MKQTRINKRTRSSKLSAVVLACFMLLAFAAPALAHHKEGHEQGNGGANAQNENAQNGGAKDNDGDAGNEEKTWTEDNDTNDGGTPNNVEDDGDNAHPSGKDRSVEHGNSSSNPNQGKAESDPDDDGRGPDRTNGGPDKPNGSGGVDKADQDGNNGCGNDDDFEDDNEGWCGRAPSKGGTKPDTNKPCDADATMPGTQPCNNNGGGNQPCDADATMPGTQPCNNNGGGNNPNKITICHATGSATNPYVIITIDESGLNGHADHEGDIIPMPADGVCPVVEGGVIDTPDVDEDESTPDEVLNDVISRDETPDVVADSVTPAERGAQILGAVLPFTGASLLGFLGAALALIAAGFAALKLRKS